jgi:hypothetical protein
VQHYSACQQCENTDTSASQITTAGSLLVSALAWRRPWVWYHPLLTALGADHGQGYTNTSPAAAMSAARCAADRVKRATASCCTAAATAAAAAALAGACSAAERFPRRLPAKRLHAACRIPCGCPPLCLAHPFVCSLTTYQPIRMRLLCSRGSKAFLSMSSRKYL